jgi:hypothetical protein
MGKKLFVFLAFVSLVFLLTSFTSCNKNANSSTPPPTEIKGDLKILHASPQGETQSCRETQEIIVIFDHPMAALEPLPQEEKASILKFEPSFSGKSRWLGTKALAFTPKARLPYGTEIRVTVPAGLRSLDGYALKENYSWSFNTIRPKLINHYPQDGAKQQKLETQVLLIFNQPMDEDKVKNGLVFLGTGPDNQDYTPAFTLDHPSAKKLEEADIRNPADNVLLLAPKEKLRPEFTYSVGLNAGLPGKEGPLGIEAAVHLVFETFKSFKFKELEDKEGRNPHEPLLFRFSNPVIYKDFVEKIKFEPAVQIPDYYKEWDHGDEMIYISLPLEPETKYTAWIAADLKDEFGNALGKEARVNFSTSSYAPSVSMTTGHGVIEAYGDLVYPFYALNTAQVRLQGAPINKEDVVQILAGEKAFDSSESFSLRPGFYKVDKPLNLKLPKNKRQLVPIPLKDMIADKYGLIFIQLDTLTSEKWGRYLKAFLQVTELGITGKFSPDNNVIWVTELRSGLPVAEAEVEIRDDGNSLRWKGKTDKDGKVQTPGWKSLGMKRKDEWNKPQQWVFARRGKDIAFASSEWGTGIDPYRFEISYDWNPEPEKIRGTIFTERGIYRAGEQVHIKGIIRKREKGQWKLPSLKDVECEIQDPFQKTVYKGKASLDAYGSFALDLDTREDAALGYYHIAANVPPESPGDKPTSISESFRVEAFRPAEFEVLLRTLKESYVFGDEYRAEIRGSYLFGGAMSGQKANWYLRLNPTSYTPPGNKGFIFGSEIEFWDETNYSERSRLLASGEANLNQEGKIEIKAPLLPEKENTTVSAALEATVQSPSRRSISNRIQTLVHQGEYYIGLKPQTTFLQKGDKLAVQAITVNPDGVAAPDKKISVKLIKREWQSVRKAEVGGRFKWISEKVDTEVAVRELKTKKEPVEISFQPEKSGFYLIFAEGQDGRKNKITTTTYVYVTGKDFVPWERKDDDTLELVADSDRYKPGDRARILVKSPYEKAKALVTVEREFILQTQVIEIQGNASQIEIPILPEFIPNAYVSVLLVQGRTANAAAGDSEDVGKPSFKIGYLNLPVDPAEKRLSVDIVTDKKGYKPRDKIEIRLKVKDIKNAGTQASLAVAVVDVGVLNLIGYQTPDAFGNFYGEKPLSIQTSESRLHVVGQRHYGEKAENVGGGGAPELAKGVSLTEVQLRGDFKSTAYWNPSLITDDKGEAVVQFTLPDNLTTFRIMAVAQTKDSRFGQNEATFKVSKLLLLLPSLPRFARVGDKFQAGVVVNNYSTEKGKVALSLEAKGLVLKDKPLKEFVLAAGEGKEVLYSFEVEKAGKANFAFRAKMGQDSDGLEISLPLQLPRPTEAVATYDETAESKEEKVIIPDTIYPDQSSIEVQASASALTGLKGCLDYLADYPYLCLEQRLSSILPFIVAPQIIQDFKLSPLEPKEIVKRVQNTIKDIYGCQKENGGFGLWPDSAMESPYITCYAVFALLKAQAAGYDIQKNRLEETVNYLRNLLQLKPEEFHYRYSLKVIRTIQAFALYNLALLGRSEPAYAEKLFQERDKLSLFGKALLLKAFYAAKGTPNARNTILQDLLNKIKVTASQAHFEEDDDAWLSWIYSSNARTTAIILQTLLETGADHPLISAMARWLVSERKTGRWHSTQENFFVFYALNDFYRIYEKVKPDFKAEVTLAKKILLKEIFKSASQTARASVPLTDFKAGKELPLKFAKEGPGTLYYGARLTYAPRRQLEPRDEGFAVYKKIESLAGKPLESIEAGSLVVVTLQILVPKESLFVVVDDPLPAGFEAVNAGFLTESEEKQRQLGMLEASGEAESWWEEFNHIEMHDNRVLLFADSLAAGLHTHRYLARALTFGQFAVPGTKAEEMYAAEVFGRSAEQLVKIVK